MGQMWEKTGLSPLREADSNGEPEVEKDVVRCAKQYRRFAFVYLGPKPAAWLRH